MKQINKLLEASELANSVESICDDYINYGYYIIGAQLDIGAGEESFKIVFAGKKYTTRTDASGQIIKYQGAPNSPSSYNFLDRILLSCKRQESSSEIANAVITKTIIKATLVSGSNDNSCEYSAPIEKKDQLMLDINNTFKLWHNKAGTPKIVKVVPKKPH